MDLKRTVDEISTLYALEPDVCDVYVEGATDKHFVDWYLRRKGFANVTVYPIDVVDVPLDVLANHSLQAGSNRSKVIALSCELATKQPEKRRVMCIVDRDSDDGSDCLLTNPYLFSTDCNSLELYALTPIVMEKFLLVALAGFPITADSLIPKVVSVLETIFSIRQANERLKFGMKWIPFSKYVCIDMYNISFREKEFINAYLQKNDKWPQLEQFNLTKAEIQRGLSPEIAKRVRGHDLAELLHTVVMKFRKDRAFKNSTVLEGCLMASIEAQDLECHPLFAELERHATVG